MHLMTRRAVLFLAVAASCLVSNVSRAADLKVGDAAPEFEAQDDSGKTWKSSDYVGKKFIVVYFYPADCTGGCTKQAQGYRDDIKKLEDAGIVVVGVSGDTVSNHAFFKQKEKLNFPLLADTDGGIAAKFGVPSTKGDKEVTTELDGKKQILKRSVTTQRWTYVIGKDGKILLKRDKVDKPAEDSKVVLDAVAKASGK